MNKSLIHCIVFLCGLLMIIPVYSSDIKIEHVKIPDNHLLKTTFKQKRFLQGISKPIESQGELIVLGNKGIIWNTSSPFPSTVLITHQGLYQIVDNTPQSVLKSDNNSMMSMISTILTGSFIEGVKDFEVMAHPHPNKKRWIIELIPKEKTMKSFLNSINIEGAEYVQSIVIQRTNGDKDVIVIENHSIYVGKEIDRVLAPEHKEWLNG